MAQENTNTYVSLTFFSAFYAPTFRNREFTPFRSLECCALSALRTLESGISYGFPHVLYFFFTALGSSNWFLWAFGVPCRRHQAWPFHGCLLTCALFMLNIVTPVLSGIAVLPPFGRGQITAHIRRSRYWIPKAKTLTLTNRGYRASDLNFRNFN